MMLDNQSPIPLYHQLKAAIQEQIASGKWKPGDRVPSEAELGELFQVSRTTVRQALGELTNQGLLNRIQGRGTFIAQPRIRQRLNQLTGFTQDMQSRGKEPSSKILELAVRPAPSTAQEALQLGFRAEVIVLKRLRLADQLPVAVETSYLNYDLCKDLMREELSGKSLYHLLATRLNIVPTRARQQLEAIPCPPAEARLLALRKGRPVLHFHRTTFDQFGRAFEQVESFYRGDCYIFQVELTSELAAGASKHEMGLESSSGAANA